MQPNYGDNIIARNGIYQFLYTVPSSYRDRNGGPRQIVKSLKTRDIAKAKRLAAIKKNEMILRFESHDFHDIKDVSYEIAVNTAKRLGLTDISPEQVRDATPHDFVELMSDRVEARESTPRPNIAEVKTFIASVEVPLLPASKVYPRWRQLKPEKVAKKLDDDAATYWRRYERYGEIFIECMGDRDMCKLNAQNVDEYRDLLLQRVLKGDFQSRNANRAMRYMRTMLTVVLKRDFPAVANPFLSFETIDMDDAGKRENLTEAEVRKIREKLTTSRISDATKAILMIAQNSGVGARELCQLAPEDICLDEEIPHIKIRKNQFRNYLKTKDRAREIALVGVALEWMKKFPEGFPDHRTVKGINKMNRSIQGFVSTTVPGKTFTGYRHRIAELMRNSEFKDQWQNAVMGHASPGKTGYYGGPVWLKNTHKLLMETLPEDNR